jgi:hypothetical protein
MDGMYDQTIEDEDDFSPFFHHSLLRSLNTENIKYLNISRAEAGTGQREQQELENRFATLFLNSVCD